MNPFRYRGYYYDSGTELYYLRSRYYNPEWGRFLNADAYVDTEEYGFGGNMFAYCGNEPIISVDYSGCESFLVTSDMSRLQITRKAMNIFENCSVFSIKYKKTTCWSPNTGTFIATVPSHIYSGRNFNGDWFTIFYTHDDRVNFLNETVKGIWLTYSVKDWISYMNYKHKSIWLKINDALLSSIYEEYGGSNDDVEYYLSALQQCSSLPSLISATIDCYSLAILFLNWLSTKIRDKEDKYICSCLQNHLQYPQDRIMILLKAEYWGPDYWGNNKLKTVIYPY